MKCMDSVKGITPLNTRFPPVFLLPWNLSSWKVLKVLVWAAAPHFRALRLEKCFSRAPHKHTEPQITCLIFIKKYYSISVRSMQKMLSSEFPGASWSLNVHRNTATRLHQNTQYHRAFKRNNRCNTLNLTTHNPSKRIHLQSRSNVLWTVWLLDNEVWLFLFDLIYRLRLWVILNVMHLINTDCWSVFVSVI